MSTTNPNPAVRRMTIAEFKRHVESRPAGEILFDSERQPWFSRNTVDREMAIRATFGSIAFLSRPNTIILRSPHARLSLLGVSRVENDPSEEQGNVYRVVCGTPEDGTERAFTLVFSNL